MSPAHLPIEQLVQHVHHLDRSQCIDALIDFDGIPLDFDRGYLDQLSLERLRHILVAACLAVKRRSA